MPFNSINYIDVMEKAIVKIVCSILILLIAIWGLLGLVIYPSDLMGTAFICYAVGLTINWQWSMRNNLLHITPLIVVLAVHIGLGMALLSYLNDFYGKNMITITTVALLTLRVIVSMVFWYFLGMPWRKEAKRIEVEAA